MSKYFQKLKKDIDKDGLGPASLPFLKETMKEKIKLLDSSLNIQIKRNAENKRTGKVVDYQKIDEKINYLQDEQAILKKEEQIQ